MSKPIAIPMSAKRTDTFTPEALKDTPKECTFQIRIPTPSERDTIGSRLFELGLSPVTDETMRAHMIDELYKIDWAAGALPIAPSFDDPKPGDPAFNEIYSEQQAEFLDSYWERQKTEDLAMDLWQEQEAQRLLDEGEGAPEREPPAMPVKSIKIREHARAKLLVDDIMSRSQRIRSLAARKMDYGRQNAAMMVRLHLLSMTPADPDAFAKEAGADELELERDATGMLTMESVDRVREFFGNAAWHELVERTDGHFSLMETERKNSVSPPEKPSDQTGSGEPSGDSESSGGGWTESSTGPTPPDGSATTTGKSSGSASASAGRTKKAGRTGAAS